MKQEEVLVIGGGPCGLAAAISLTTDKRKPLIIEKGNVVNTLFHYPTHQTFFSSSEKLSIGDIPFITEDLKPKRNQALVYYREVAKRKELRINRFEKVTSVEKQGEHFLVTTTKDVYQARYVIIATGYYDRPHLMNVPGENLDHVHHYFKEAHPYFDTDVTVIGGKNSAVDAAIELNKAGARVTVLYRGSDYSPSVKPWILPEFEALVRSGQVMMKFNAEVTSITGECVHYTEEGTQRSVKADFVFAMTGYRPDHQFLRKMGVEIDELTGRPIVDEETMETNVPGIFIAGVIAAGNNANEIFIENGRFHGEQIAQAINRLTV